MTLSELSIRRPVLAAVLSLLIVVAGLASISSLPIRELPDVDSSVVSVTTTYTGAAPEIVDTDITEVIDSAVAGISGVKTITSSSQRGRSTTTIEFELGRDIDEAAGDVRAAVARVRGQLPDEVDEPQVVKSDSDADPVMRLAVYSDRMTPSEVTDYLERFIVDRITTIDGVANVRVYGERRAAIRIWLDRGRLAAHNLTVADVEAALRNNNVELPAGEVESNTRLFTVRLDSRLSTPEQFSEILLKEAEGAAIRLGDVARVNTGVEDDSTIVRANGLTAIGIAVQRQSQSNTIAISNAVKAELARLNEQLPEGMQIFVGSDDAVFVSASIKEVVTALAISLVLVVLVILVFLRSVRATLIPAITIPVSLIGCFSLIYILGFSLNVLTLLALLLAIGLVVDDAIVMLENIERRLASGETRLQAVSARLAPGDLRHPGDLHHPDCGVRADLVPAGGSRQVVHRIRVRAGQCSGHFNVRRAQRLPRACLENPESPRGYRGRRDSHAGGPCLPVVPGCGESGHRQSGSGDRLVHRLCRVQLPGLQGRAAGAHPHRGPLGDVHSADCAARLQPEIHRPAGGGAGRQAGGGSGQVEHRYHLYLHRVP
jgi:multidrug efflux pump